MTQQFYSELFLFTWELVHVSTMSHRITAMLELYGGRVTGQLKLLHDKEAKSPEAGTGIMVRSYWGFVVFSFNQKNRVFKFYLCVLCYNLIDLEHSFHGGLLL